MRSPAGVRHILRCAAAAGLAAAALAAPPAEAASHSGRIRAEIVSAARRQLGRQFQGDCSGFVLSILRGAGVRVALRPGRSRSESLFHACRPVSKPRPGDLAFFHNTYDRNHDGRANDRYTHVALVEAVNGSAMLLLHRGIHGIERLRMNLARPSDPAANDAVRRPAAGDPAGTRILAGELFAGFGAVLPR